MSWAFITALKKNPQQSYVQLLNNIRDELATRYTQKPQLSCSHPLSKTVRGPCSLESSHSMVPGGRRLVVASPTKATEKQYRTSLG